MNISMQLFTLFSYNKLTLDSYKTNINKFKSPLKLNNAQNNPKYVDQNGMFIYNKPPFIDRMIDLMGYF